VSRLREVDLPKQLHKPDWLDAWKSIESLVQRSVTTLAESYAISALDLRLHALLHLPRYSQSDLASPELVVGELERLAKRISELQSSFKTWLWRENEHELKVITEAPDETARIIHERFHYIGTFRAGRHFATFCNSQDSIPAALATVSPMDVLKLRSYVGSGRADNSLLLARVFAFRWAPRNSISFLLGGIARRLRKEKLADTLITWVNPNLGFGGSSYRAANWSLIGSEPFIYRYIDGNYVTAREVFHSTRLAQSEICFSKFRLEPLQIWKRQIGR
jgi:hypothetical protein